MALFSHTPVSVAKRVDAWKLQLTSVRNSCTWFLKHWTPPPPFLYLLSVFIVYILWEVVFFIKTKSPHVWTSGNITNLRSSLKHKQLNRLWYFHLVVLYTTTLFFLNLRHKSGLLLKKGKNKQSNISFSRNKQPSLHN